jgi:lysophospholipase L1-like esterase
MNHLSSLKNHALVALAGMLAAMFMWTAHAGADDCPQALTAYWRLGETAAPFVDRVGGHNGTCTNCPTATTDGAIASDGAQTFDAADDGITIASATIFSWAETDNFSIELWMKRSSNPDVEVLVARNDGTTQTLWKIEILTNGRARFTLRASDGDSASLTGTKVLDNDVWHHIAVVRNGATDEITLYVDGKIESQTTKHFSAGFASDAGLTLGWIDDSSPERFGGQLDEVAITNGVLSDNDIQAHYFLSRAYCGLYNSAVSIMPLGDSITDDNQNLTFGTLGNSYRKPLWDDLNASRFWVDFVGSRANETSDFDNDHEGQPGATDNEIADVVQAYLDYNPAEVVLLHIGTNDLDDNATSTQNILANIDSWSGGDGERITVLLARIINRIPNSQTSTDYNDNVEAMATARIANGDKIIMVDMEDGAGLIYDYDSNGGDFVDYLHPDDGGYVKMADLWYTKLDPLLPMVDPPQITSSAVLTAAVGELYTYDVDASGTPSPVFSLTTNPAGMTIDAATGVIQWTPTAAGNEDVVVQAQGVDTSWAVDTQSFTISITANNPPRITSSAPTEASAGKRYEYNAAATDSDNDTLTWSLVSGPPGMSIDASTGVVTWTPSAGDIGTANCSIAVSDGRGGEANQVFSIRVTKSNSGGGGGGSGCFITSMF